MTIYLHCLIPPPQVWVLYCNDPGFKPFEDFQKIHFPLSRIAKSLPIFSTLRFAPLLGRWLTDVRDVPRVGSGRFNPRCLPLWIAKISESPHKPLSPCPRLPHVRWSNFLEGKLVVHMCFPFWFGECISTSWSTDDFFVVTRNHARPRNFTTCMSQEVSKRLVSGL